MTNFPIDDDLANCLLKKPDSSKGRLVLDAVINPKEMDEAVCSLLDWRKKQDCHLLHNPAIDRSQLGLKSLNKTPQIRQVRGGLLVQSPGSFVLDLNHSELARTGPPLTDQVKKDLLLAWAIGSTSASNTITLVKDDQLIGNSFAGVDRVGCCRQAVQLAKENGHCIKGAVAYSDSFFPFVDGPQVLIEAGVETIFASSGSVNDKEVMEVCEQTGVTFITLPDEICRGFFGH